VHAAGFKRPSDLRHSVWNAVAQAYTPSFSGWAGTNGDWPAINWAGVESQKVSVALLNKGLPSYCIEKRRNVFLSLLRSPAVPTYLHEPQYYSMTEYDGMRDSGRHCFEYALTSYSEPFAESRWLRMRKRTTRKAVAVLGEARLPELPR